MQRKLTITHEGRVQVKPHTVIGRPRISRCLESSERFHLKGKQLDIAYRQMAKDDTREAEALEWAEATLEDVSERSKKR